MSRQPRHVACVFCISCFMYLHVVSYLRHSDYVVFLIVCVPTLCDTGPARPSPSRGRDSSTNWSRRPRGAWTPNRSSTFFLLFTEVYAHLQKIYCALIHSSDHTAHRISSQYIPQMELATAEEKDKQTRLGGIVAEQVRLALLA